MGAIAIFLSGFKLFWRQKDAAYLLFATAFVINFISLFIEDGLFRLSVATDPNPNAELIEWLAFLAKTFAILCSAAVGVAWHRNAILHEGVRINSYHLARREVWGYVFSSIILSILAILIFALYSAIWGQLERISGDIPLILDIFLLIVLICWFIGGIYLLALFLRMSIILPAAATSQPLSIFLALSATNGHMKSFMLAIILISLATIAIIAPLPYIFPNFDKDAFTYEQSLAEITCGALLASAIGMYIVGVVSSLYIHFVDEPSQKS